METAEKTNETVEKTMQPPDKINLFIVDGDIQYSQSLKKSLENEFHERLDVKIFTTWKSAEDEIKSAKKKPQVVLLDYLNNKPLNINIGKHTIDDISKISPNIGIIMLSDKKYGDQAIKALAYGAHDCVVKDKFAHQHVVTSVKKALNPPKL